MKKKWKDTKKGKDWMRNYLRIYYRVYRNKHRAKITKYNREYMRVYQVINADKINEQARDRYWAKKANNLTLFTS